jgi:hypothetical protein
MCFKYEEIMLWLMKLLDLAIWVFFLVILIEHIVKWITKFDKFLKISKD